MFKKLFTLILFSSILISVSIAQDVKRTGGFARLWGMGANPYVIDPYFNTINPAWNAVYDNFILGDIGGMSGAPFSAGGFGQYVSGSFRINKTWTVGGLLTRNDFNGYSIALLDPGTNNNVTPIPYPGVVSTVNNFFEDQVVVPLDNNMELMGTYTTDHTSVGLGVAYASTTNEFNPDTGSTSEGSASQIGVNLGVVSNLSSTFMIDIGASLMLPSANYMPSTGNETKASQTIILVNGRAFWNMNKDLQLVPVAAFNTVSGTFDSGGTSSASVDMQSFTGFSFGLGLNYQIGDFLLAGGAMFTMASLTTPAISNVSPEITTSVTMLPIWNVGGEWNMLDWLVGRLGYIAVTGATTTETPASATSVNEFVMTFFGPPQRGVTIGIGFRFGDFSLDATVNEDVLRQGFNMFGGGDPSYTNGGATFGYLTASYALP